MKPIHIIAFTREGTFLARRLAAALGGNAWVPEKFVTSSENGSQSNLSEVTALRGTLSEWTEEHFYESSALVFVSACGIAVRAIAPFLTDKTRDPAVVCLDEKGENIISLLSGHTGGANELARHIAKITGGRAIITTATDLAGVTAVDSWAREHDFFIENPHIVKKISSAALDEEKIGVAVTEISMPAPWPVTLWLRPKNLVLGVGCKKNTPLDDLRAAVKDFLKGAGVAEKSLRAIASIDLKAGEPAILALADEYEIPFHTYSADELAHAQGHFSHSEKVLAATGVGCVCERAAVLCAGNGPLLRCKTIYPGITLALARVPAEVSGEINNGRRVSR